MKSIKLNFAHYLTLISVWAVLFLSGLGWILSRLVTGRSVFTPASSTVVELLFMKLHGFFAYLALFIFGTMVWHALQGWPTRKNRITGVVLWVLLITLVITAWVLYYAASDTLRQWGSGMHSIAGCAMAVVLFAHTRR